MARLRELLGGCMHPHDGSVGHPKSHRDRMLLGLGQEPYLSGLYTPYTFLGLFTCILYHFLYTKLVTVHKVFPEFCQ